MAVEPRMDFQTVKRIQTRAKEDGDSTAGHLHHFTVKFSPTARYTFAVNCDQPRTVLEAIKSTKRYQNKCSDENLVIQLGTQDKKFIIPTHFPCSLIGEGELLTLWCQSEEVEVTQDRANKPVRSADKYSVFYIDTVGGKDTKQKKLFRNNALKDFKYLCVYGENGMSVEEALKRDGRFIDFAIFDLSDNKNPKELTGQTQNVYLLDQKEFKLVLPPRKRTRAQHANQQVSQRASNDSQRGVQASDVVQQGANAAPKRARRASSVMPHRNRNAGVVEQQSDISVMIRKIYDRQRRQFPKLIDWMESRFPGDSFQQALELRKENFRSIDSSFREIRTSRKVTKLSESACRLDFRCRISDFHVQGTGFMLFDNLILTNAHLFENWAKLKSDELLKWIEVSALFYHEDEEVPESNKPISVRRIVELNDSQLDYAVLELDLDAPNENIPPGLLKKFGPLPQNGAACIVGHPKTKVKHWNTFGIIEKENMEQAVTSILHEYKDYLFTIYAISQEIQKDSLADVLVTYKTDDMYHGSSGSPLFDAHARVFGLHSGGFFYGFPKPGESVIEFAHPLLTIFEQFVSKLRESGDEELLKRVKEEAQENPHLQKVLESVVGLKESRQEVLLRSNEIVKTEPADPEELLEDLEQMDTD